MSAKQLSLEEAAQYLHIASREIAAHVMEGDLPYTGDASRPLFREEDLDAWASRHILAMNERKLGDFDKSAAHAHRKDDEPFSLTSLLSLERIVLKLNARTKASVISECVNCVDELGLLFDPKDLLESLRMREELCSTALPGGYAILHPRYHDPYLASESFLLFARVETPIHFGAPDGKPTDLFFTLVCHEDKIHLRALARLCMLLGNKDLINLLRTSDSANEILSAISDVEKATLK